MIYQPLVVPEIVLAVALMVVLAQWVPESPKWLLLQSTASLKGDTVSSMHNGSNTDDDHLSGTHGALTAIYQNPNYPRVSTMLRGLRPEGHDVDKEISGILADAKAESINQVDGAEVTWAEVFAYRKGMVVGIGLMFFQVRFVDVFYLACARGYSSFTKCFALTMPSLLSSM